MTQPPEPGAGPPVAPGPPPGPGPVQWEPGVPHRTHPLTPVINAVRGLGVVAAGLLVLGREGLQEAADAAGPVLALLVGAILAVLAFGVVLGFSYLSWTRTRWYFDEAGDFRLDSGIVQRNERRVALSRLQGVDVVRPLLGRVVGMAQLRVEVAGSKDSRIVVSYLSDADAMALRAQILARAAGVHPLAGEAPEQILVTVPAGDLARSLLLRSETILLLLLSVVLVVVVTITQGAAGVGLLVLTGGVPLLTSAGQFMRNFGFTVAQSPDGLRLRHGLASVASQTVPPGRVQAVEVAQPLLWRRRDWVQLRINVAGVSVGDDDDGAQQVLLPVAPVQVAQEVLARVLPGVRLDQLEFEPAPARARRRAWFQWSQLGLAVTDEVLATRSGFLTHRIGLIPHARTQSVTLQQGPWQRLLSLATVVVDSPPGPVSIQVLHRDVGQAGGIARAQLERAAQARRTAGSDRWMQPRPASPPEAHQPESDRPAP